MRILLSLILLTSSLFGQAAAFPGAVVTDAQLTVAKDNIQTSLTNAVAIGDTTLVVASSAGWVANMIATVCDSSSGTLVAGSLKCTSWEDMLVTAVGGNTLTVTRGFGGTSAAAHSSGRLVAALVKSWTHNAQSAEIIAIQTALGPNLSNINLGSSPFLNSIDYDFTPQTPGGSLVIGNTSITMTPVPQGLNGTDTGHYLYVSNGTGTAEPCLITGGAGVAGGVTGAVIINCANTHSGAWTIRSATGGVQEAVNAAGYYGSVRMPAGTIEIYAPVFFQYRISITGAGADITNLHNNSATTSVFRYIGSTAFAGTAATRGFELGGFRIYATNDPLSHSVDGSAGTALYLQDANHNSRVHDINIWNHAIGIDIVGGYYQRFTNIEIFHSKTYGIRQRNSVTAGFAQPLGVWYDNILITNYAHTGTVDTAGCGFYADNINGLYIKGFEVTHHERGFCAITTTTTDALSFGWINDLLVDTNVQGGLYIDTTNGGLAWTLHFVNFWGAFNGAPSGTTFTTAAPGVRITKGAGSIDDISFNGGRIRDNGGHGIEIQGGINVGLHGVSISTNGQLTSNTYNGVQVSAGVSQWTIANSFIGNFASGLPAMQKYGIAIAAGGSDKYIISNNNLDLGNLTGTILNGATGLNYTTAGNLPAFDAALNKQLSTGLLNATTGGASAFGTGSVLSNPSATAGAEIGQNFNVGGALRARLVGRRLASGSGGTLSLSATTAAGVLHDFWKVNESGSMVSEGVAFADLGTEANSLVICTDCAVTSGASNVCTSGGTGCLAVRLNGVWRCFAAQN